MRQLLLIMLCALALHGLAGTSRAQSAAGTPVATQPPKAQIFCAEALWCDLATGLGGDSVSPASVLTSPRIDPHDFQVTPDMALTLAQSSLVVMTGGHYDDWMTPLLDAQPNAARRVISAFDLAGLKPGDNPHLFDDPEAVGRVVDALARDLAALLPHKADDIAAAQARFHQMLDGFNARLKILHPRTQGMKIAVTEPVGGPLFAALGLEIIDPDFALAVMNHVDPAPRDVARLEEALQQKAVKALVINPAVETPSISRLIALAHRSGIAVVAFDEFPAPPLLWQDWMTVRLNRLSAALDIRN
ncbi:metal ABC transporter solute-binding protein, Zn/Mn family [Asaia bogorensis]|uniref:metal ABC transporter solute-binding protein, Zn/Mn family n=1 Tax=Asaia bogorensis TaxID=91915 RepID=UPI000EFC51F8|nr:zinc ABC transporter substrate-binding protein [Asaia bogorensis]